MSAATVVLDRLRLPVMTTQEIRKEVLKWIGVVVAAIVPLGAIYGIAAYIVRSEVSDMRSDLASIKSDISDLKTANKDTNTKIDGLLKEALERSFPSPTSSKKTISETLPQVRDLLRLAQSESVKLDPQLLTRYGNQVAQVAASNYPSATRNALDVLGDLMTSRSQQNAESVPVSLKSFVPISQVPEAVIDATLRSFLPNGQTSSATFTITRDKVVPSEQSFVYTYLGAQSPSSRGFAFLAVDGHNQSEFLLDGHKIRHVIFQHARIEFDGGPVNLEDVYFVDCTFDIKSGASARPSMLQAFSNAVLSSSPATFTAS